MAPILLLIHGLFGGAALEARAEQLRLPPEELTEIEPRTPRVPAPSERTQQEALAAQRAQWLSEYRAIWDGHRQRVCPSRDRACLAVVEQLQLYRSTYGSFCGTHQLLARRGLQTMGTVAIEPLLRALELDDFVLVVFAREMVIDLGARARLSEWCRARRGHPRHAGICVEL